MLQSDAPAPARRAVTELVIRPDHSIGLIGLSEPELYQVDLELY